MFAGKLNDDKESRSSMMAGRAALRLVAMAAVAVLAACDGVTGERFGQQLEPYRYRLTAIVDTPKGERRGSSVIEVQWSEPGTIMGTQGSAGHTVKGEAVAVDLADGQTLFVLLRSPANPDWAAWALRDVIPNLKDATGADRAVHPLPRQYRQISETVDNYPYMVRFRDPADPQSVEQVDPADLAKSFGPGIRLKSLTVQVTDDMLTLGIEERLGWLEAVGRQRATLIKRPQRNKGEGLPLLLDAKPIQLISPSDFSTELYK